MPVPEAEAKRGKKQGKARGRRKATLCHEASEGDWRTIVVARPAVPAHLWPTATVRGAVPFVWPGRGERVRPPERPALLLPADGHVHLRWAVRGRLRCRRLREYGRSSATVVAAVSGKHPRRVRSGVWPRGDWVFEPCQ